VLRIVVVAFLLLVPAAAGRNGAEPAGTKIVFLSTRDGTADLYALDPADGRIARITRGADIPEPELVVVSRDGSLVAYPRSDDKIDIVGTDGRSRGTIACKQRNFGVSLSPTGRQAACMTTYETLAVVDVDGGAARTIATGLTASWSPDGRWIAFVDEEFHVSVVPAAGGEPRRLTTHRADFLSGLTWSSDSERIAFYSDSGVAGLYVVSVDGSGERLVDRHAGDPVSWSPDGTTLAFEDTRTEQIVTLDVRTRARRQVTHERGSKAGAPSWSPDGTRLVYLRVRPFHGGFGDVELDLYTIAPDGSGRRRLTTPFPEGGAIVRPWWTPGAIVGGNSPPRISVVRLGPARQLVLHDSIYRVVADGARAATSVANDCVSVIWNVVTRRQNRVRTCFADDVDTEPMYEIALSGSRFAWIQLCSCRYGSYNELHVRGPHESVTFGGGIDYRAGTGVVLANLAGDRGLLAFDATPVASHDLAEQQLWIVPPRGGPGGDCPAAGARICKRLRSGDGAEVLDVDGGRILAAREDGTLLLLSDDDRILNEWSLRPGERTGAQVTGGDVVVTTAQEVRVYDAASGALRNRWPLPADVVTPRLIDAAAGFAVYLRGGAVHVLRLGDGRDVALYAPRQSELVSAQLERTGLFYLSNRLGARTPGRLAFVPLARLRRLVARAG
jgi:Tol biopolymer transport system component